MQDGEEFEGGHRSNCWGEEGREARKKVDRKMGRFKAERVV